MCVILKSYKLEHTPLANTASGNLRFKLLCFCPIQPLKGLIQCVLGCVCITVIVTISTGARCTRGSPSCFCSGWAVKICLSSLSTSYALGPPRRMAWYTLSSWTTAVSDRLSFPLPQTPCSVLLSSCLKLPVSSSCRRFGSLLCTCGSCIFSSGLSRDRACLQTEALV